MLAWHPVLGSYIADIIYMESERCSKVQTNEIEKWKYQNSADSHPWTIAALLATGPIILIADSTISLIAPK
jgi:hypothetical protein